MTATLVPSAIARHLMPFKCVRIDVLDQYGSPVRHHSKNREGGGPVVASGFLWREGTSTYLYTCWHVVTGIDLTNPVLPGGMQRRSRLRVLTQASTPHPGGAAITIGGPESFEVDLLDGSTEPPRPLWEQDEKSAQNDSLAMANLSEPFWHDLVRIRLPDSVVLASVQVLTLQDLWSNVVAPGDPLLLVGYPYGFSAQRFSPTPIVLKRHIAANTRGNARREVLIDGGGAAGMSGGPVFCEHADQLYLFGVYTGIVFPDAGEGIDPERTTALGAVCPMNLLHHLKLARPAI